MALSQPGDRRQPSERLNLTEYTDHRGSRDTSRPTPIYLIDQIHTFLSKSVPSSAFMFTPCDFSYRKTFIPVMDDGQDYETRDAMYYAYRGDLLLKAHTSRFMQHLGMPLLGKSLESTSNAEVHARFNQHIFNVESTHPAVSGDVHRQSTIFEYHYTFDRQFQVAFWRWMTGYMVTIPENLEEPIICWDVHEELQGIFLRQDRPDEYPEGECWRILFQDEIKHLPGGWSSKWLSGAQIRSLIGVSRLSSRSDLRVILQAHGRWHVCLGGRLTPEYIVNALGKRDRVGGNKTSVPSDPYYGTGPTPLARAALQNTRCHHTEDDPNHEWVPPQGRIIRGEVFPLPGTGYKQRVHETGLRCVFCNEPSPQHISPLLLHRMATTLSSSDFDYYFDQWRAAWIEVSKSLDEKDPVFVTAATGEKFCKPLSDWPLPEGFSQGVCFTDGVSRTEVHRNMTMHHVHVPEYINGRSFAMIRMLPLFVISPFFAGKVVIGNRFPGNISKQWRDFSFLSKPYCMIRFTPLPHNLSCLVGDAGHWSDQVGTFRSFLEIGGSIYGTDEAVLMYLDDYCAVYDYDNDRGALTNYLILPYGWTAPRPMEVVIRRDGVIDVAYFDVFTRDTIKSLQKYEKQQPRQVRPFSYSLDRQDDPIWVSDPYAKIDRGSHVLVIAFGTRGDIVPLEYYARLLVRLGVKTAFLTAKIDSAEDLRKIAKGDFREQVPAFAGLMTVGNAGWKHVVLPFVDTSGSFTVYEMAPDLSLAAPVTFGRNPIGLMAAWLASRTDPHFKIGCTKLSDSGRSTDGFNLLRKSAGLNVKVGWTCGSDMEEVIPITVRNAYPKIPEGDHRLLFQEYGLIHCHGGAGTMQTAAMCGAKARSHGRDLDRRYYRDLHPDDVQDTSPWPLIFDVLMSIQEYRKIPILAWRYLPLYLLKRSRRVAPWALLTFFKSMLLASFVISNLRNLSAIGIVILTTFWKFRDILQLLVTPGVFLLWEFPVLIFPSSLHWLVVIPLAMSFLGPAWASDYYSCKNSPWRLRFYRMKPTNSIPGHVAIHNVITGKTYEGGFIMDTGPGIDKPFWFRESGRVVHDHIIDIPVQVDEYRLFELLGMSGPYGPFFNCQTFAFACLPYHAGFSSFLLSFVAAIGVVVLTSWSILDQTRDYLPEEHRDYLDELITLHIPMFADRIPVDIDARTLYRTQQKIVYDGPTPIGVQFSRTVTIRDIPSSAAPELVQMLEVLEKSKAKKLKAADLPDEIDLWDWKRFSLIPSSAFESCSNCSREATILYYGKLEGDYVLEARCKFCHYSPRRTRWTEHVRLTMSYRFKEKARRYRQAIEGAEVFASQFEDRENHLYILAHRLLFGSGNGLGPILDSYCARRDHNSSWKAWVSPSSASGLKNHWDRGPIRWNKLEPFLLFKREDYHVKKVGRKHYMLVRGEGLPPRNHMRII